MVQIHFHAPCRAPAACFRLRFYSEYLVVVPDDAVYQLCGCALHSAIVIVGVLVPTNSTVEDMMS